MGEDFDSDFDGRRRPRFPRANRTSWSQRHFVDTDGFDPRRGDGPDLHRARSSGQGPAPNINIYNRMYQEDFEDNSGSRSPRGRANLRPEDFMVPGHPARPGRSRSRSALNADDLEAYRREWRQQARDEEDEARKREEDAVRHFQREEEDRQREQRDLIRRAKLEEEEKEQKRKEELLAAVREEEDKKRKEKEKRKELLAQARQDEEDEKEKKKQMLLQLKAEEEAKKEKEKKEWAEWEAKQLAKKQKEKEDKEKKDQEYFDRVSKDFAHLGLTQTQIKTWIKQEEDNDKARANGTLRVRGNELGRPRSRSMLGAAERPVYPKIHRHDITVQTLKYFGLAWEYDRHDRDYIIILRELTEDETDQLFEHSRKIKTRESTKLLEAPGRGRKEDDFVWIKKRDKSHNRDRSRSGMRERFAENLVRHL